MPHYFNCKKEKGKKKAFSMEEEEVEVGSSNLGSNLGKSEPTPHTPAGAQQLRKLLCSSRDHITGNLPWFTSI